ncbi:hypothetical protein [Leucobacter aridicollis]|uniref:hypothetical protein n=1 Tax=Leucobacter aridicollis TaxID=283878 RepID=UPI0021051232|nr:hypothetical protein [Leucobacter aridicollis]UTX53280.1 hypothetical protein KI794_00480 [Leucobacter aridicollis]
MASIDDKVEALNFRAQTTRTAEQIAQLLSDAAEVGGTIAITRVGSGMYRGSVQNLVRVEQAEFTVKLTKAAGGAVYDVRFTVDDYLRARSVIGFTPVSPWRAPAYEPLRTFAERLQNGL